MTTFYLSSSSANWVQQLASALRDAQDGDTIRVDSEAKAEMGLRALGRIAPEKKVCFAVVQEATS